MLPNIGEKNMVSYHLAADLGIFVDRDELHGNHIRTESMLLLPVQPVHMQAA